MAKDPKKDKDAEKKAPEPAVVKKYPLQVAPGCSVICGKRTYGPGEEVKLEMFGKLSDKWTEKDQRERMDVLIQRKKIIKN